MNSLYSVKCVMLHLCKIHTVLMYHDVQCTSVQCTMYDVRCTLYTVRCTMKTYSVQRMMNYVRCTIYAL